VYSSSLRLPSLTQRLHEDGLIALRLKASVEFGVHQSLARLPQAV
jgi:hypothetical protein